MNADWRRLDWDTRLKLIRLEDSAFAASAPRDVAAVVSHASSRGLRPEFAVDVSVDAVVESSSLTPVMEALSVDACSVARAA